MPQAMAALRDTPVVYLQGPRQAGKSTLGQALRDDGHDADYFTLLYTGSTSAAFGPNLHVVPVSALWQLEAQLAES